MKRRKLYFNDSEVRGYDPATGTYLKFPTEQEYDEYLKEQEDNDEDDR